MAAKRPVCVCARVLEVWIGTLQVVYKKAADRFALRTGLQGSSPGRSVCRRKTDRVVRSEHFFQARAASGAELPAVRPRGPARATLTVRGAQRTGRKDKGVVRNVNPVTAAAVCVFDVSRVSCSKRTLE